MGRTEAHLEVDGTDIHPSTVDPRLAADLIYSFFSVLGRAASAAGVPLHLQGISIEDKCFRTSFNTSEPELTLKAMEIVSGWVSGSEALESKQDEEAVRHFANVVRRFGEKATASVAVGGWERLLDLSDLRVQLEPYSTTTLRVRLVDIGVEPARARFTSGSEIKPFSIAVSLADAKKLGHHIGQPLDLKFTYRRDRYGVIEEGTILDFHPMDLDDDGSEWLRWLTKHGEHWDEVSDPLKELGRRDDD